MLEGEGITAPDAAGAPPVSEASDDQRLMISQRMQARGPGRQEGTWLAAGAINDAGIATATAIVVKHGGGKALVKATHILTSVDGTMTLESHTWLRPFPPPTPPRVMVEGPWKQIAGTGVYAELQARGQLYATVEQTTGEITIVRDGSAEYGG
jgi:hypothetical protein